jgi:peptide deformylase
MAILDLVDKDHPLLKTELPHFDFSNPPVDPVQLAKDLTETMISNHGLGLAANQVGLPYRVFVLTGETVYACFNPRIVDFSQEMVYMNEGCLSYPGFVVKIKRPWNIRVRFTMPNGETATAKLEGLTARCFQHELDHLNGLCHLDLAKPFHKEKAYRLMKAHNRILKKTGTI